MIDPIRNFIQVEASTGYDADDTDIVLAMTDSLQLPDPSIEGAYNLVWWNSTDYPNPVDDPNKEIIRVLEVDYYSDTLTVVRGMEGTTASTKNTGGKTYSLILTLLEDNASKWVGQGGDGRLAFTTVGSLKGSFGAIANGLPSLLLRPDGQIILAPQDDFDNISSAGMFTSSEIEDSTGGMFIKPDGTKMYLVEDTLLSEVDSNIYQYTLTTPFDITTAVYDSVFADLETLSPNDDVLYRTLMFNPDGTKMFTISRSGFDLFQWDLSTPWDLSTLTHEKSESLPSGIGGGMSHDGRYFYVVNNSDDDIEQFLLKRPWDIEDMVSIGSASVESGNPHTVTFNSTGTRMFVGYGIGSLEEYTLSEPWMIETASHVRTALGNDASLVYFCPQNGRLYRVETNGIEIHSYTPLMSSSMLIQLLSNHASANGVVAAFGTASGNDVQTQVNVVRDGANIGGLRTLNSIFGLGYGTGTDMVFNSSGRVQIAHTVDRTTGAAYLTINPSSDHRTTLSSAYLQIVGDGSNGNTLLDVANTPGTHIIRHSTGSIATPGATESGNLLGGLQAYGYDGSAYETIGRLLFHAPNTMSDTEHGGQILAYTTPIGSTSGSLDVSMIIANAQSMFTETFRGQPGAGVTSAHATRSSTDDLGNPANSFFHAWHAANDTGDEVGISFNVSTSTTNLGALITHYRTNANSQGGLKFYTKASTTGGGPPVLAMTIDENQDVEFEEDVFINGASVSHLGVSEQTGTSYTFALTDDGTMVEFDNAATVTVTVPDEATIAFPIGTKILLRQKNIGVLMIEGDAGVTVSSAVGDTTIGQDAVAGLLKVGSDSWVLFGDLQFLGS